MRVVIAILAVWGVVLVATWIALWLVTLPKRWTIEGLDGETRYQSLLDWLRTR